MIVALVPVNTISPVQAADEQAVPIVYKLTHLGFDGKPSQPGWGWIGERSGPPNISYQSFGANMESTAVGQKREFHFDVPETGQQGAAEQAIAYLEDFIAYIKAPALPQQGLISANAVAALETEALGIIASWSIMRGSEQPEMPTLDDSGKLES